ncbi:MAG: prolyl oligopeptidase family serine peptidase, partial [Acidobacteriota bacterium]
MIKPPARPARRAHRGAPRAAALALVAALAAGPLVADDPRTADVAAAETIGVDGRLTMKQIMADPDWFGRAPQQPYWAEDGRAIYYRQKRMGVRDRDLVRLRLDAEGRPVGAPETLDAAATSLADTRGVYSADRSHKLSVRHGDLFLTDLRPDVPAAERLRQLTRTVDSERSPQFLNDGRIAFQRGETLFVLDPASGLISQPAEIHFADDPADEPPDDDYLSAQQRRLFVTVRDELAEVTRAREEARDARESDATRVPPAFYLGKKVELLSQTLAPSGRWLLVVTRPATAEDGRRDQMPNYISPDGYVRVRDVRPKVGTGDGSGHQLLVLDLERGTRTEVDLSSLPAITEDPLADVRTEGEAFLAEQAAAAGDDDATEADGAEAANDSDEATAGDSGETGTPRAVEFELRAWHPDGDQLAIQAHSVDNKDRWTLLVDRDGAARTIHHLRNVDGWINWHYNTMAWLPDGRLWFLSEESDYAHLYLWTPDGAGAGRVDALTRGAFVVNEPTVTDDDRAIVFRANVTHPGVYELYRVALPAAGAPPARATDAPQALTALGGWNEGVPSPDGRWLLITHSTTTRPPELYLQRAEPGAQAVRLTETVTDAYARLPWQAPEIVAVPSTHQDRPVYARLYRPTGAAANLKRAADGTLPAVFFIHGAGYLQNAHAGWSGYFRETMFHNLLAQHGYVVLDMDYRGSRGYGASWRTAIYRQMGTPEVEDLADGIDWLVAEHGVDRDRIGVYGGSYGGFLTFMAMFKRPELFAAGASLRPVTDWAHYNHPYTANILNTPEVDPVAYARSSPIEFADGLARPVLICAGMQDDNVLFQDTVRLVQRLIELEKEDFETAIYPIEPHGFR